MKIIDVHGNRLLTVCDDGSYLVERLDKSEMPVLTRDYEFAIMCFLNMKKATLAATGMTN